MILVDQTTGCEVARQLATTHKRPDVGKIYPGVYGSGKGGFSADFDLAKYPHLSAALIHGDHLQVVARYAFSKMNGEQGAVDCWLSAPQFSNANAGHLDAFQIRGQQLKVSGWYADGRSLSTPYRYVILVDQTTGQEVARQQVTSVVRNDVAKAYPNIYNARHAGFNTDFDLTKNLRLANAIKNGHSLQVVARYSDQKNNGEGNFVQTWFNGGYFTQNVANLDHFAITTKGISATGWHGADQSVNRPYHYTILLDKTTGRELSRVLNAPVERKDVENVFPTIYNSRYSGFSVNFKMSEQLKKAIDSGHQFQVVDRYTSDRNGNRDTIDYWFKPL